MDSTLGEIFLQLYRHDKNLFFDAILALPILRLLFGTNLTSFDETIAMLIAVAIKYDMDENNEFCFKSIPIDVFNNYFDHLVDTGVLVEK